MAGDGQDVLWITDSDEVAPNDERHIDACKIIGHILGHYLNSDVGRFRFGTTRSDNGTLELEDMVSLPDFAAGALPEVVASMAKSGILSTDGVLSPMRRDFPKKAQALVAWLADNRFSLKKMAFIIDSLPSQSVRTKLLHLYVDTPNPQYDPFLAMD